MKKVIKLTESQLRSLIDAELMSEAGLDQARVEGPLKKFVSNMQSAKQALGELFQQVSDQKASDQCQALLNAVNRIINAVDNMPELTRDPWHGVRKRG